MRLRMMPTTKKRLGGMGLFMRHPDGGVSGPGSSPRQGVVGLPATPGPPALPGAGPISTGHAQLPQLQPPHEIVAARQHRQLPDPPSPAAARSIPVPNRAARHAASAAPAQPAATMSVPAQHFHPMQRTRTTASDSAPDGQRNPNAWEDSTVASMFGGERESRAASERLRAHQASHGRHYSDAPQQQRTHQSQPARTQAQAQHDENLPFVIGENGMLKVIAPLSVTKAPSAAPPHTSAPGGIFDDESVKPDDVYHDVQPYETPTKANGLRRAKLPYRDNRDLRSNASSDRTGAGYSPESQGLNLSPERAAEAGHHIDKLRSQERATRDRERERERRLQLERELQHKRSTVFQDLTPLEFDEPDYSDAKAAVAARGGAIDDEALQEDLQRTPRAKRRPQPPQSFPPPQNILTNDALLPPLGRTNSSRRRLKSPTKEFPPPPPSPLPPGPPSTAAASRKRRHSLDYNDAELHAMSYGDLRGQSFDHDPQAAALRQTTAPQPPQPPPAGAGTMEERLAHYKGRGGLDQHDFVARLSVDEWDEAGDWLLAQFGGVVQRLQQARRARRRLVQRFEDEVAAREEAVRAKMEGIGRTLEDLRHEGQTMMQGKEVDLDG
ncbi:hypothetical protein BT67DRAFT_216526 [Trichocladium antarcticum]|uniref:Extracellular mutant protein 11 C-terminal domain-containing protein n=1 Tax=Trichocladium antarcticum TaxID=1450529 RepID=A0AAN6ZAE8_9PEZI|nr:hypothetical protein BT67DRAFT_216526 [Trichocladium antarcticum]